MITDKLLEMGRQLSLNTGAAGSYLIGTILDLGAGRNHGLGGSGPTVAITISTAPTSGGAATLAVELVTGDAANLSDAVPIASTGVYALAAMPIGKTLMMSRMPSSGNYKRYIGLRQITGVAAFTAGKIEANITQDGREWTAYPSQAGGLN